MNLTIIYIDFIIMRKAYLLFLTILFLSSSNLIAQEGDSSSFQHPIDIKLDECLNDEVNFSTHAMLNCTSQAEQDWDTELNRVYRELRALCSDSEKNALRTAQLKWLEYRDNEFEFAQELYGNMQGTMFQLFLASKRMEIVKTRTLELQNYLNDKQGF